MKIKTRENETFQMCLDNEDNIEIVSQKISALNGRVTTLESGSTSIPTIQDNITTLQNAITTAQGNITTIQSNVTTAQNNITTLQANLLTTQNSVISNGNDITSLTNRVSSLETDTSGILTMQNNISSLQNDVTNLTTRVSNVESATSNISTIQSNVNNLSGRVSALETSASLIPTIQSNVSIMQGDVSTIQTNITSLTSRVTTLENATPSGAGNAESPILLRTIVPKALYKLSTETIGYVAKMNFKANTIATLNLSFDIVSKMSGQSGQLLLEIKYGEDSIYKETLSFTDVNKKINVNTIIDGTGNDIQLYFNGTCLSVDASSNVIACYLKNINILVNAIDPIFREESIGAFVEEIPSGAQSRANNVYVVSCGTDGLHVILYDPSTSTYSNADSSTGLFVSATTSPIKSVGTIIGQIVNSSNVYQANAMFFRLHIAGTAQSNQVGITSGYNLSPSVTLNQIWCTELYNTVLRGTSGINSTLTNSFRCLMFNYNSGSNNLQVVGVKNYGQITNSLFFDVPLPSAVTGVQNVYSVTNIWGNSQNYGTMVVYQNLNDDLYFQAYNMDRTTSGLLSNYLSLTGSCIKIGNGHTCTARYENGVITFYYVRKHKIYSSTLTISTGVVSDEIYIMEGQYYKKTNGGYAVRNNGVLTYVPNT